MRCFKVDNYFREEEESTVVLDFAKDRLIGNAARFFIMSEIALIQLNTRFF
jgi:hypothetical protein